MRKKMAVICFMIIVLFAAGCDKLKGDKGDTGPAGATGATGPAGPTGPAGLDTGSMFKYENTLASDGDWIVTLPIDITTDDIVQVYYAIESAPNVYTELGEPTGDNSGVLYRWAMIVFRDDKVYLENMAAGDKYLIIIIKKA